MKEFEAKIEEELLKAQEDEEDPPEGEEAKAKPEPERPEFPLEEFNLEFEAAN